MPTPPFTYAGPSTGAAFTAGVLNLQWDLAIDKVNEMTGFVDNAIALATNPAQIATPSIDQSTTIPAAPTIPVYDPNAIDNRYETYFHEISTFLNTQFVSFISTYFPTSGYITYAQTWIENVFNVGGTGFAPGIEDQIWQRDRSRLLLDSSRQQQESIATWANRGYPLPPGAANGALLRLQQDALDKVASSSRDRAIEAAKIEIDNLRFAVTNAIDLRMKSLGAAFDMIRAMALGPQIGSQVAVAVSNAEVAFAETISRLFSAEVTASEIPVRLKIADAELKERANEQNNRASIEAQHDRVTAAVAAAGSLGNISAAALNALHAQTGITAQESI